MLRTAPADRFLWAGFLVLAGAAAGCGEHAIPSPRGQLFVLAGSVTVVRGGTETVHAAREKPLLEAGDAIRTGEGGEALVEGSGITTYLRQKSELVYQPVGGPAGSPPSSELLRGLATFLVPRAEASKDYRFEAVTNSVVAAVKGTVFEVELQPDGSTAVTVLRGGVELKRPGSAAILASVTGGERAVVPSDPGGAPAVSKLTEADQKRRQAALTAASLLAEALGRGLTLSQY